MGAIVREGVTSFKMFMAYPGVFLVDDQQIFRAMLRAGELGALICMHAENGPADRRARRSARSREGHTAPIYHALTRPEVAEATGTERAIALAEMAKVPGVHGAPLGAARARARDGGARPRPAGVRRDLPAVPVPREDDLRGEPGDEFEGREVRVHAAAAPEAPPRAPVARPAQLRPPGRRDRSLPVLHEGPEGARARTTSRRSRTACRASRRACTCCGRACAQGKISMNRFVEITSTAPAKIFGMYRARRARSPSAPTPTSSCGIRRSATSCSAQDTCTCGSTTRRTRASTVPGAPSHVFSRGELIVENDKWVAQEQARAAASSCAAGRSGL